jgi:hypothetical protein
MENDQDEASQIEFLKDQVQRLNAALSRYQKKYLPLEDTGPQEDSLSERGPRPPWLYSSRYVIWCGNGLSLEFLLIINLILYVVS